MPIQSVVHKELRLVATFAYGRVTLADVTAHQDRLRRDPDFHADFSQLLDATALTAADHQLDQVAYGRPFSPASRLAIVADSNYVHAIARMLLTYLDPPHSSGGVFLDRPSALRWLGLPPDIPLHAPITASFDPPLPL